MDISPAISSRTCDISTWTEPDISKLSARGNRRYQKRKSAIIDYFTTDLSIEEITLKHHLSSEILMKLIEQCLMQHEDGSPWGFRALMPGTVVVDHSPKSEPEQSPLSTQPTEILSPDTTEEVKNGLSFPTDRSTSEDEDGGIG